MLRVIMPLGKIRYRYQEICHLPTGTVFGWISRFLIPKSNSFVLYRNWIGSDDKISGSVKLKYPVRKGVAPDTLPLSWAHRGIRYRLVDSQGMNILVSNSVTLPNIPANLSLQSKNGKNVQFEFPGSRKSGLGDYRTPRGVGTLSDTMSVEPHSRGIVRSGTGYAVDAEGDKVT